MVVDVAGADVTGVSILASVACGNGALRRIVSDGGVETLASDSGGSGFSPVDVELDANAETLSADAADVESASHLFDSSSVDYSDGWTPDTATTRLDAEATTNIACNDSADTLLKFLGSSLGANYYCGRALSTGWSEGVIDLNSEGQVTYIRDEFNRIDDPQAWVDSLSAYRWPCLAGRSSTMDAAPNLCELAQLIVAQNQSAPSERS